MKALTPCVVCVTWACHRTRTTRRRPCRPLSALSSHPTTRLGRTRPFAPLYTKQWPLGTPFVCAPLAGTGHFILGMLREELGLFAPSHTAVRWPRGAPMVSTPVVNDHSFSWHAEHRTRAFCSHLHHTTAAWCTLGVCTSFGRPSHPMHAGRRTRPFCSPSHSSATPWVPAPLVDTGHSILGMLRTELCCLLPSTPYDGRFERPSYPHVLLWMLTIFHPCGVLSPELSLVPPLHTARLPLGAPLVAVSLVDDVDHYILGMPRAELSLSAPLHAVHRPLGTSG